MPDKTEPPKIGIKYCGGCKPGYNRVKLVEQMQLRLEGKVRFLPAKSEGISLILAIQGCPTACADLSAFKQHTIWSIKSPEDAEKLIARIECLLAK